MKVADMHCDTILRLYDETAEGLRENTGHIDLRKMAAADYLVQNFAIFIDTGAVENPFEKAMGAIDRYYLELEKNRDLILPAYSYADILDNRAKGKMSAVLTIEEGGEIKGNLEFLRNFYRLGVRMMTLTWNYDNEIGHPNMRWNADHTMPLLHERNDEGLTEFGIACVEEMERLGMIPDVSHLSDGGFWDVAKHTKKPFVASHSNAYAKCGICRNLTDDMIRCLGERGGVTGLNLAADFLIDSETTTAKEQLEAMAAHVAHITDVGGMDVCGLGSDFDGIGTNPAVPDASFMPRIADALRKKGFSEDDVEKVFYRNVLRVYKDTLK